MSERTKNKTREQGLEEVLREFVADMKLAHGAGRGDKIDEKGMDWPDLAVTFRKAAKALAAKPADDYDPAYHKMTSEQREAYLKHKGFRCPYCRSKGIDGTGTNETDGSVHGEQMTCNHCGAVWENVYTFSDVAGIKPPAKEHR